MAFLKKLLAFLSSFGFAAILLVFLTLLTFLGTLEQVEHGLFETQKKYFESMFLVHWAGPIPIPLPGVYLLLSLLLLNLTCGGIVRMRKDLARAGILVAHLGIVLMLVAGFVKYRFSVDGHLRLWPRDMSLADYRLRYDPKATAVPPTSGDEFQGYYDWELSIREAVATGRTTEYLVPHTEWADALEKGPVTFTHDRLPFDVVVRRWMKNAQVVSDQTHPPMMRAEDTFPSVDGYVLWQQPLAVEAEANVAGLVATLREKATGRMTTAQFWGLEFGGFTFESGGKTWLLHLQHRRWKLPFAIALDKFTFETHPGISRAAVFLSDVTKTEDGAQQKSKITMNEPMRHKGFTLFQSGYGPPNVPVDWPHYSDFAVVSNPSDQWPKYSCFIIAAGLLFHFSMKLMKYVRSENRLARPTVAARAAIGSADVEADEAFAAGSKKR
ncbi:MAG TPA: cytochrome c biogenesis protein ResB [Planctomycetota bacterium]|jgi:hypothetical protein|nr:cytochrome c biogenesis protein ResB [Planctomycetota bacterium]